MIHTSDFVWQFISLWQYRTIHIFVEIRDVQAMWSILSLQDLHLLQSETSPVSALYYTIF